MITIEQMVQREVLCCMSSLVSTLARPWHVDGTAVDEELAGLHDQACELAAPVLDYEEAALQHGAKISLLEDGKNAGKWIVLDQPHDCDMHATFYDDAHNAGVAYCEHHNLDPYEWEVYEHWAVTQWLAEKLVAHGERIDTDFAGLNIWARTTTGQAISMDGVVQKIYREMVK